MKLRNNHKGFSLVELVVVAGIVGIIASMSIIIINRLRVANTEKVVKSITNNLTKAQMKSMSKEEKLYVYIYKLGDDLYTAVSTDTSDIVNAVGRNGTLIGKGITITYENSTGTHDAATTTLKVGYKRDGTFLDSAPTKIHVVTSAQSTTIKLNKLTGKYVINHE